MYILKKTVPIFTCVFAIVFSTASHGYESCEGSFKLNMGISTSSSHTELVPLRTTEVEFPASRSPIEQILDIKSENFFSTYFQSYPAAIDPLLALLKRKGLFVHNYLLDTIKKLEDTDLEVYEIAQKAADKIFADFSIDQPNYIPPDSELKKMKISKKRFSFIKSALVDLKKSSHISSKLLAAAIFQAMRNMSYRKVLIANASRCHGGMQAGDKVYFTLAKDRYGIGIGVVKVVKHNGAIIRTSGTDYNVNNSHLMRHCGTFRNIGVGDKVFYPSGSQQIEARVIGVNQENGRIAIKGLSGQQYHVNYGILTLAEKAPGDHSIFKRNSFGLLSKYFIKRKLRKLIRDSKPQNYSVSYSQVQSTLLIPQTPAITLAPLTNASELSLSEITNHVSKEVSEFARIESHLFELSSLYFGTSGELVRFLDSLSGDTKAIESLRYGQIAKLESDRATINAQILDEIDRLETELQRLSNVIDESSFVLQRSLDNTDESSNRGVHLRSQIELLKELSSQVTNLSSEISKLSQIVLAEREKFEMLKAVLEKDTGATDARLIQVNNLLEFLQAKQGN